MPGYVSNVLSKFQHDAPKHPQHTPSKYVTPVYGAKTQYATKDETPYLTAKQCLNIKKSHRIRFVFVKLLPLPQPSLHARTDARTNPSAQRATQLRSVIARVYAVSRQNQITTTIR
jgi:hypothetical protein